jgi:flavin-dependent dehydrogenase
MSADRDRLVQLVGIDALAKGFSGAVTAAKEAVKGDMEITDRKSVTLPLDGQKVKVATVAYRNGSAPQWKASVVDRAAFMAWVRQEHPEAIVETVAEWLVAEVLKNAQRDHVAADSNGEVIPGVEVEMSTGGNPTIAVEQEKTPEAKAALMAAIFTDGAAGLRSLVAAIEPPAGES